MTEEVERLEEKAEIARARLQARVKRVNNQYSLSAFKQAGQQLGRKSDSRSLGSRLESLVKNPASSALITLAASQLYRGQQAHRPKGVPGSEERATRADGHEAGNREVADTHQAISATQKAANVWARRHPVLAGATALAIGIGAGYVLLNGRKKE